MVNGAGTTVAAGWLKRPVSLLDLATS